LIVAGCTYSWTSQANTNVEDGGYVSSATTVEQCQSACINNASCTGIDWVLSTSSTERCWLSGPWSGQKNEGTTDGVTHYDLTRNCAGQTYRRSCWIVHCWMQKLRFHTMQCFGRQLGHFALIVLVP